ncbi:hypothetical protein ADEAN_000926600 [Angomonas deanei]|uniref:Uncharacterized protein n=1 Tax=Angomonas deanei TaxID=59799 RepID=A0A7G2CRV5_9TRYP|nr:hypothetical protein ADEAN_000926600 [Angomonas deanei]
MGSAVKRQRALEEDFHPSPLKHTKPENNNNTRVTTVSPTRTLERLSQQKVVHEEEERLLSLLLLVMEAFKQVFGERYAWRHFGATQATRQDLRTDRRTSQQLSTHPVPLDDETVLQAIFSGLEESGKTIECVFPRLRQQYKLFHHHNENKECPPPLDMLVYYETFVTSLSELI